MQMEREWEYSRSHTPFPQFKKEKYSIVKSQPFSYWIFSSMIFWWGGRYKWDIESLDGSLHCPSLYWIFIWPQDKEKYNRNVSYMMNTGKIHPLHVIWSKFVQTAFTHLTMLISNKRSVYLWLLRRFNR